MENNEKETTPCDGNMDHSDDTPKNNDCEQRDSSTSSSDSQPSSHITSNTASETVTSNTASETVTSNTASETETESEKLTFGFESTEEPTFIPEFVVAHGHRSHRMAGSVVRTIGIGTRHEIDVLFQLLTLRCCCRSYLTEVMNLASNKHTFEIRTVGDTRHEVHFLHGSTSVIVQIEPRPGFLFDVGLVEEEINAIPTLAVTKEIIDEFERCPICLEDFMNDEEIKRLDCNHVFHVDCIKTWLLMNNFCPVCRTCPLTNDEIPRPSSQDVQNAIRDLRSELRSAICELITLFVEPSSASLFCPYVDDFAEYLARLLQPRADRANRRYQLLRDVASNEETGENNDDGQNPAE